MYYKIDLTIFHAAPFIKSLVSLTTHLDGLRYMSGAFRVFSYISTFHSWVGGNGLLYEEFLKCKELPVYVPLRSGIQVINCFTHWYSVPPVNPFCSQNAGSYLFCPFIVAVHSSVFAFDSLINIRIRTAIRASFHYTCAFQIKSFRSVCTVAKVWAEGEAEEDVYVWTSTHGRAVNDTSARIVPSNNIHWAPGYWINAPIYALINRDLTVVSGLLVTYYLNDTEVD